MQISKEKYRIPNYDDYLGKNEKNEFHMIEDIPSDIDGQKLFVNEKGEYSLFWGWELINE